MLVYKMFIVQLPFLKLCWIQIFENYFNMKHIISKRSGWLKSGMWKELECVQEPRHKTWSINLSGEVTIGIIQGAIFSPHAKNFIDKVKNIPLCLKQIRDQQQPSKEH